MKISNNVQRWLTFAAVYLSVFMTSFAQYQLPPIANDLMDTLGMTQQQYSSAYNAPTWCAVFLGIVVGILADKIGVKKIVTVGYVLTVIGLIWRVNITGSSTLFLSCLLTGFVAMTVSTNRAKIFGAWFKPSELGIIMGLSMTTTPLASTLAFSTTALFPSRQVAFTVSCIFGVVMFLFWTLLMKEKPDGVEFPPPQPVLEYLKTVGKNPFIWLIAVTLFFVMGSQVTLMAFLSSALQSRGVSAVNAGFYSTAATIGCGVGSIIVPPICRILGRFKPVMAAITILGAVCLYFGWQMPIGAPVYIVMLVGGICIGAAIPLICTFPILIVGREYAGSAMGICATLQLLGAATIVTYFIVPVAKGNFTMMYALGAACMICVLILSMILPELGVKGKKAKAVVAESK